MTIYLKRAALVLILGLVAVWIQGTVLRGLFSAQGVVPNLVLILVVFLGFYELSVFGALLAFLVGLEFDLFSGVRLGPWAGTLVFLYGCLACFAQRIFVDSSLSSMVAVFFSSIAGSLMYLLFMYGAHPSAGDMFWKLLLEALFTAVCAPFFFMFLKKTVYKREPVSGRMTSQLM